jgi:hypothetical protein
MILYLRVEAELTPNSGGRARDPRGLDDFTAGPKGPALYLVEVFLRVGCGAVAAAAPIVVVADELENLPGGFPLHRPVFNPWRRENCRVVNRDVVGSVESIGELDAFDDVRAIAVPSRSAVVGVIGVENPFVERHGIDDQRVAIPPGD